MIQWGAEYNENKQDLHELNVTLSFLPNFFVQNHQKSPIYRLVFAKLFCILTPLCEVTKKFGKSAHPNATMWRGGRFLCMALEQLLNAYIPRGKNIKYNDEFTDKAVVIGNGHRTTNDRTSEKTVPKLIFSSMTERFTRKQMLIQMIEIYISYYNTRRVHRNLGVLTPFEKHNLYIAA